MSLFLVPSHLSIHACPYFSFFVQFFLSFCRPSTIQPGLENRNSCPAEHSATACGFGYSGAGDRRTCCAWEFGISLGRTDPERVWGYPKALSHLAINIGHTLFLSPMSTSRMPVSDLSLPCNLSTGRWKRRAETLRDKPTHQIQ